MTQNSTLLPQAIEPATDACTLYVVRHGTTTMNVENRYRGRCDVPLDAQGYQDAVDAARQLSHLGLSAVYAGGLRRTIATAQIIADEARIPDIRIMHGLINVDYGAWEGLTAHEAELYDPEAFHLYKTSPSRAVCPNGERLRDAQKRMLEALTTIGARHPGERVVVEQWRIPVGRGSYTSMSAKDGRIRLEQLPAGTDVD
jgi:broad specificity phosphatase PhoE